MMAFIFGRAGQGGMDNRKGGVNCYTMCRSDELKETGAGEH